MGEMFLLVIDALSRWMGVEIVNAASTQNTIEHLHTIFARFGSGVARPGPTRACALPSTSQALPSPIQLESRDSTTNQTKVKKNTYLSCCANHYRSVIVYIMLQYNSNNHSFSLLSAH